MTGGSAWTLTHHLHPGKPPASFRDHTQKQWEWEEGRGRRPNQTKALQAPPPAVSSFLQVLLFGPLTPSKEAHQGPALGWGQGYEVLFGPFHTPTHSCSLAYHQMPQQTKPFLVSATWAASSDFREFPKPLGKHKKARPVLLLPSQKISVQRQLRPGILSGHGIFLNEALPEGSSDT